MNVPEYFCGKNFSFLLNKKTYVMGILNVTPDSFSDGGKYFSPESAVSHAVSMQNTGADIIDVGAMSTRPGAEIISPEEEISRLRGVLPLLSKEISVPISADTYNVETARYALEHGAAIINDVSGKFDPEMAKLIKEYGAGWVIVHGGDSNAESSCTKDIIGSVNSFFKSAVSAAEMCGIDKKSICLDVGIGFGKSRDDDAYLLGDLKKINTLGCALLVGASRKRFIGEVTGESEPSKRDAGTVAAHTLAIAGGADIIRAHDVFSAVGGALTADRIVRYRKTDDEQTDRIIIEGLKIFAYHGVNPEEKTDGQNFILDIYADAAVRKACYSDDLGDTVNYAKIIKTVKRAMTENKYDLIEKAAQKVSDAVFDEFPAIRKLRITLKKPEAPINADFGFVAAEIVRER
ncbi:MAG: dihydropteroate synthase [Clostridiales bacterium]|nr:dihydropteroate synthase [Clostridiales bacterium]